MLNVIKRCAAVFAVLLAVQVLGSAFAVAYAQSPGGETQSPKIAYITLDDGPSRSLTPQNLDTLKRYGVKATFFVLPRSGMDDLYQRIVEEGHAIGNHSYSHDYNYLYRSTENFKRDVIKAGNFIYEKTGCTPTAFRFPGGSMGLSKSVVQARADILAGLGYDYFDWDVTTADTDPHLRTYGNEEYIVNLLTNNILKNTGNRKKLIILMHDTSGYSSKALPRIIEGLQKQGYTFGVLAKDGGWQYRLNENGEAVITGYIGGDAAVTVPALLEGHSVTSIDSDVFTDDPITSINIPSGVVNIDSGAFWECGTLQSININEGNPKYQSVDGVAFSDGGTVLLHYPAGKTQPSDTYRVPQSVVIIGRCAFDHNQTLREIVISDSVVQIEEAAFWRCAALSSVNLPMSVAEMGSSAFANCNRLSAIAVAPDNPSFTSVDGVVFDITGTLLQQYPPGKSGSYTVPEGVGSIEEGAFRGSNGLTQVILSDSVTRIGNAAFAFCEGLTDVRLGSGLLSIGSLAFQGCSSLHSVVMPAGLEAVEGMAFESCVSLTDVYFLGDVPDFGNNVFQNTAQEFAVDYLESQGESWTDYADYPPKPFSDMPYFNDVASGAWYKQAVNFVAARGIPSDTSNGNFRPEDKLTRGAFMVMLMRAYGIEPDTDPLDNFSDAGDTYYTGYLAAAKRLGIFSDAGDTYYTGYLAAAKRLGISNGMGGNLFAPEQEITRQDMFALLYNALDVVGQLPAGNSGKTLADFSDAEQISPYASEAVALLVETGAVGGSNGALTPLDTTTRADMAQVLYNLLGK